MLFTGAGGGVQQGGDVQDPATDRGCAHAEAAGRQMAAPNDLQLAAVSRWLHSGVPATEVGRRPGTASLSCSRSTPLHRRLGRRRQQAHP